MTRQVEQVSTKEWFDSPWRIAGRILANALLVVAMAVAVAIAVVPRVLGGNALTVVSGSMRPALQPGDIIVTKGVDAESACSQIAIGDIITFLPRSDDPTLVTHRVVEKRINVIDTEDACNFVTQGDDNSGIDDPISPIQVRGIFLYRIPLIGWVSHFLGNWAGIIVGAVAVAAIGFGLRLLIIRPRNVANSAGNPATDPPEEQ